MTGIEGHVAAMMDVPPKDWWQFVGCEVCNSPRREPCRKGGGAWPEKLGRPHAARYRAGLDMHGTLWLLQRFPQDVLGDDLRVTP
jgi:hypothetical protein